MPSRIASLTASHILSGWPSVTDSEVKRFLCTATLPWYAPVWHVELTCCPWCCTALKVAWRTPATRPASRQDRQRSEPPLGQLIWMFNHLPTMPRDQFAGPGSTAGPETRNSSYRQRLPRCVHALSRVSCTC